MATWTRALLVTGVAVWLAIGGVAGSAHAKSGCAAICRDEVRACVRGTRSAVRRVCHHARPKPPFCRNAEALIQRQCRRIVRTCAAAMPNDPICGSPSGAFLDLMLDVARHGTLLTGDQWVPASMHFPGCSAAADRRNADTLRAIGARDILALPGHPRASPPPP